MKYNCDKFEETIWEHARTGVELSAEAQAHLAQCPECRQTLRDAKLIMGAVLESDCIPYAPDCRQAVLDRIAPRKKSPRLAWAYAFSGAVFAGISALALINVFTHVSPEMPAAKLQAPRAGVRQSYKQPDPTPLASTKKIELPKLTAKVAHPPKSYRMRVLHDNLRPKPQTPYMVAELPSSPNPVGTETTGAYTGYVTAPVGSYSFHYDSVKETADGAVGEELKFSAAKSDISGCVDNFTVHYADSFATGNVDAVGTDAKRDSTVAFDEGASSFEKDASVISANALSKPATGLRLSSAAEGSELNARVRYKSVYTSAREERPVALAVAHWSNAQDDAAVNYSYSYSDKNPATGEVTECSVKRTGDCVEIILESKPEEKDPSRRGSTDYEILAKI